MRDRTLDVGELDGEQVERAEPAVALEPPQRGRVRVHVLDRLELRDRHVRAGDREAAVLVAPHHPDPARGTGGDTHRLRGDAAQRADGHAAAAVAHEPDVRAVGRVRGEDAGTGVASREDEVGVPLSGNSLRGADRRRDALHDERVGLERLPARDDLAGRGVDRGVDVDRRRVGGVVRNRGRRAGAESPLDDEASRLRERQDGQAAADRAVTSDPYASALFGPLRTSAGADGCEALSRHAEVLRQARRAAGRCRPRHASGNRVLHHRRQRSHVASRRGSLGSKLIAGPRSSPFIRYVPTSIVSPSVWWVAAGRTRSAIAVTSDAGKSWRASTLPVRTSEVSGISARRAWLTTSQAASALYATSDAGDSWHRLAVPAP